MCQVQLKRVYEPPEETDGWRVLVDRLWPRGLKKENAMINMWLKDVAPSPELRVWFGHKPERWIRFSREYKAELKRSESAADLLRQLQYHPRITLLYAARDEAHNHAIVLLDYLCSKNKMITKIYHHGTKTHQTG